MKILSETGREINCSKKYLNELQNSPSNKVSQEEIEKMLNRG